MNRLERAIYELQQAERLSDGDHLMQRMHARVKTIVVLLFLGCVLSTNPEKPFGLLLFFLFPIISCRMAGIGYGQVFLRSLVVLPFVLLVGLFNPILDREVVLTIAGIPLTSGWLSFLSILWRALLAVQGVCVWILSTGFHPICRELHRLGLPLLLISCLQFVYRYLIVLLQEALNMSRARQSRGFGRRSYPLKMWSVFAGQLLLRTVSRAERIHRAMLSRGFNGEIPCPSSPRWKMADTVYLCLWTLSLLLFRLYPLTSNF